jgi:methylglutaconyl-CoA hydratase
MAELITYQKSSQGVITITLNRPDKHNAFNEQMIADLMEAFVLANQDKTARVVVLKATGTTFCAGADLKWMKKMVNYDYETNHKDAMQLAAMLNQLYTLNKPTIACVNGAAFGGAVGLIACCDVAIATKLSKFCLSEVLLGLTPATIAPYVIKAIGARNAKRYMQTAEVFSAKSARKIGLLSKVVSEEDLDQTVAKFTQQFSAASPQALSITKQLIDMVDGQNIDQSLMQKTAATIASIRVSEEGQEGLNAFFSKRKANWYQDDNND